MNYIVKIARILFPNKIIRIEITQESIDEISKQIDEE